MSKEPWEYVAFYDGAMAYYMTLGRWETQATPTRGASYSICHCLCHEGMAHHENQKCVCNGGEGFV